MVPAATVSVGDVAPAYGPTASAFDPGATVLKVYGEGEWKWKVRQYGIGKRRTWRKLHIAVDAQTQEVVAVEFTANVVADAEVLPVLLE